MMGLQKWLPTLLKSPGRWLFVVLFLALLSVLPTSRLGVVSSLTKLLPKDAPELQQLREISSLLDGEGFVVIKLEGAIEDRLEVARQLVAPLRLASSVSFAEVEFPLDFIVERALYFLPHETLGELDTELKRSLLTAWLPIPETGRTFDWQSSGLENALFGTDKSFFRRTSSGTWTIHTLDDQALLVLVQPRISIDHTIDELREFVETVHQSFSTTEASQRNVRLVMAGAPMITLSDQDILSRDIFRASLLALLLVVLVMVIMTRRLSTLLVLSVPLIVGLLWTLASTFLTIGHLNIMSGFMVPVLVGLGADFCIHLHLTYLDNLQSGLLPQEAMKKTILSRLKPCAISAFTTSLASFALFVHEFKGVSEFGIIASFGILLFLIAVFVSYPPLALLVVGTKTGKRSSASSFAGEVLSIKWKVLVAFVAMVAILFFAPKADKLRFFNDYKVLMADSPERKVYEEFTTMTGTSMRPSLFLVKSLEEVTTLENVITDVAAKQSGLQASDFGFILSIKRFMPNLEKVHAEKLAQIRTSLGLIPEFVLTGSQKESFDYLRRQADAKPWKENEIPKVFRKLLTAGGGQWRTVFVWPSDAMWTDEMFARWTSNVELVLERVRTAGVEVRPYNHVGGLNRGVLILKRDFPKMLLMAFLAVFLILVVAFRRPIPVLLILSSVVFGVWLMAGVLVWFGASINIYNLVVLPVIIGVAIDNAVHLVDGYIETGNMGRAVATRGKAVLLSSLTTGLGFGTLAIAQHGGVYSLGEAAIVGICSTFFFTSIVLPAMLIPSGKRNPA